MMDVYSAPKTDLSVSVKLEISVWKKIAAIILIGLSCALYAWVVSLLPMYEQLFTSFGSELPGATVFALNSDWLLLGLMVLNLVALIITFVPLKYEIRLFAYRYCLASIFVSVVMYVIFSWAMSLPFVQMVDAF